MKLCNDIKFFYQSFSSINTNIIMGEELLMLSLLKVTFKELFNLICDIIDPDINYDSIEDMIE